MLLVATAWPCVAAAAVPQITYTIPAAVRPGHTVDLTLVGDNVSGATQLWTSFPSTSTLASGDSKGAAPKSVTYRVEVPRSTPPCIGAVRLATMDGASRLRLLMIDDLASTVDVPENHTLATAQAVTLPIAVDGTCQAEKSDYFKFTATAGQRIAIEVVARRLGSSLDPVVRLLDAAGKELAYADDEPAIGPDSRLVYRIEKAGQYIVDLRDIRFEGGDGHRYRLRLGDFPLATTPYPVAAPKGSYTSIGLTGRALEGLNSFTTLMPVDMPADRLNLRVAYPNGHGSSWVTLLGVATADQLEHEPNDAPQNSTACRLPGGLEGRLETAGDRDFFHFEARKGDRLVFSGQTRSLGSPADLYLRLYKADGASVAEVDDSGADEGRLDYKVPADGIYRLKIEDVNGSGGPQHVYRIDVQPFAAGFTLGLDNERFNAPEAGVFVAKVTCARVDYKGPIELAIEGIEGCTLKNSTIAAGKAETTLNVTLPTSLKAGQMAAVAIVGRAKIGERSVQAKASTMRVIRQAQHGLSNPPAELEGSVAIGVTSKFPKFFELAVASPASVLPHPGRPTYVKVQAKRLADFKDRIEFAVKGLPAGVKVKAPALEKGASEARVELTTDQPLPQTLQSFQIVGSAVFKDQPQQFVLESLELRPPPPIQLALEVAGPLTVGGKQKVMLAFEGMTITTANHANFQAGVVRGSEGPQPPQYPGFEPDNGAAKFSRAAAGRIDAMLPELSSGDYSMELWFISAATGEAPTADPVAAYIFSRAVAGGRAATGEHLGIGGSLPATPRDKLFIYNGQSIVPGRTPVTPDAWHHVVYVRSGDQVRVYLDGVTNMPEVAGQLTRGIEAGQVVFASRSDNYAPLEGRLDEIALYNGELGAERIAAHYQAGKTGSGYAALVLADKPVAYWRLSETAGDIAHDTAGAATQRTLELTWKNLPPGVTAPTTAQLPGDQSKIELELASSSTLAPGKIENVTVTAKLKVDDRAVNVESAPTALAITKP